MSTNNVEVTVSNRTVLRVLALVVVAFLGVQAFRSLAHPLTLILIAFFLACALNPAVHWISSRLKNNNRTMAIAVAFLIVLTTLVTFFSLVIPPLAKQVSEFVRDVPETVQSVKTQDSALGRTVRKYKLDSKIDDFTNDFSSRVSARPVLDIAGRIGETIVSILAVLAMTFMMLNEGPGWARRLATFIPEEDRKHRSELIGKMYGMVTGFVNGQFIVATVAGFVTLVALLIASSVVHASVNAVALAGIVAIFGLIPLIGNPMGYATVILACLLSSTNLAIVIAIFFLVYAQIENVTLQPYVQGKQNELTPLTVFVSALLGISFGGIIGALFAIPVAGCIRILLIDWTERKGYRAPAKKAA